MLRRHRSVIVEQTTPHIQIRILLVITEQTTADIEIRIPLVLAYRTTTNHRTSNIHPHPHIIVKQTTPHIQIRILLVITEQTTADIEVRIFLVTEQTTADIQIRIFMIAIIRRRSRGSAGFRAWRGDARFRNPFGSLGNDRTGLP
ncbi:hypothetical protein AB0M48_12195 [Lentzea sp. NPDC051208]|uniref:hypothetical protein n=1 Tax=Lentzea sp. NPDC051208 TaxID=3154642 RepID=UPI00343D8780